VRWVVLLVRRDQARSGRSPRTQGEIHRLPVSRVPWDRAWPCTPGTL